MENRLDLPRNRSGVQSALLSFGELTDACNVHPSYIMELVQEGVLDPVADQDSSWRFEGSSLEKVRSVLDLQSNLGVNLSGAALALELMQEVDNLGRRIEPRV